MSVAFKATCQSGPSEGLFLTAHIHQWREEAAGSLIYDLSQGPRALWLCQGLSAGGGEAFMRVKRTMVSWRRTGSALSAAPMLMQWVVSKSTLLWKFTRSVKETLLERMFQAWTCITWSKGYGTKTARTNSRQRNIITSSVQLTQRYTLKGLNAAVPSVCPTDHPNDCRTTLLHSLRERITFWWKVKFAVFRKLNWKEDLIFYAAECNFSQRKHQKGPI